MLHRELQLLEPLLVPPLLLHRVLQPEVLLLHLPKCYSAQSITLVQRSTRMNSSLARRSSSVRRARSCWLWSGRGLATAGLGPGSGLGLRLCSSCFANSDLRRVM